MSEPPEPERLARTRRDRARAMTAHWSLRRRLGLYFGGLGVLAAVLTTAVILSTVLFVKSGNAVIYRWQPAVGSTQRLLTDLVDQETGVRGYVLSKDHSFLTPYNDAIEQQGVDDRRVRDLVKGDRAILARLDRLEAAATQWQHTIAAPAVQLADAHSDFAAAVLEGVQARVLFDRIRSRATELADEVDRRSATARSHRTSAGIVFITSLSLSGLVVLLGGLILWRGLRRWVLAPVDALAGQTRVVASGDTHREIEPAGPAELTALSNDVEAMRRRIAAELMRAEQARAELLRQGEELARSNQDLQQFAYVASHDLSEPLRKVANFCQLLERHYGDQLDDRAKQYIDFAVDGAKRMQVLITDLLSLSRVGRSSEPFDPVDLNTVYEQAVRTLADRIAEAGARVEVTGTLPVVAGDRSLLVSLFENLIGNAVKYRREDVAPVIAIDVPPSRDDDEDWTFTVTDNGIGIEQQYAERIFAVFQRLHLRDQYGGTGIGLALCRRIVEFHGGHIGLADVQSAHGATFRFTLPKGEPSAEPRD